MKNLYLKLAGVLNLLTAIIHIIGGQIDLVNPLIKSDLNNQQTGELVAVWHMVTILLFLSSYYLIKAGFSKAKARDDSLLKAIGMLYILFGIPFLLSSFWFSVFAPQWILLIPIGLLTLLGIRNMPVNKNE